MSDALRNALAVCIDFAESGSLRGKPAGWHGDMIRAARAALAALPEQRPQAPEPDPEVQRVQFWMAYNDFTRQCGHEPSMLDVWLMGRDEMDMSGRAFKQGAPAAPADFEAWWQEHGQFCRAGGGDYEKTFAFRAWEAALASPAAPRNDLSDPAQATNKGKAP